MEGRWQMTGICAFRTHLPSILKLLRGMSMILNPLSISGIMSFGNRLLADFGRVLFPEKIKLIAYKPLKTTTVFFLAFSVISPEGKKYCQRVKINYNKQNVYKMSTLFTILAGK